MKRTAKKLMSLGLAIALVLAGNAYTASTADAKGKGNAGKHACSQEKQKDSKSKKNKKDKKSKKHPFICTGSAMTATGSACHKDAITKKDKHKAVSGSSISAEKKERGKGKKGTRSKCKLGKIKKITVKDENTIVIKCKNKVTWKDAAVEVTDGEDNTVEAEITKKTKKKIKLTVSGLEKNEKYTVTVTGIKTKNEKKYGFVTTTFSTKK